MAKLTVEERDDLQDYARRIIRGGYDRLEDIELRLDETIADFDTQMSTRNRRILVREAVVAEVTALVAEQSKWPAMTDYDRLDLAMDTLEDSGIVARQNFTCCGTCGAAEIGMEIEDAKSAGRPAHGYVFFHEQDTEAATDPSYGKLYFNYGHATSQIEADNLAIAQALVTQLNAVGLKTEWDGSWNQRVMVHLDWKRRWTGDIPKPHKRWMF